MDRWMDGVIGKERVWSNLGQKGIFHVGGLQGYLQTLNLPGNKTYKVHFWQIIWRWFQIPPTYTQMWISLRKRSSAWIVSSNTCFSCVFFTWSTWPTMYSPPNPKICLVYALRPPPLLHFFFCSHALSQLISNGLTPTVTDRVIFGLLNHGARQCPWHSYHYFSSPFRLTLFLPTLPISFLHILNPHPLGSLPSAVFLHKVKRRVPDAGSD